MTGFMNKAMELECWDEVTPYMVTIRLGADCEFRCSLYHRATKKYVLDSLTLDQFCNLVMLGNLVQQGMIRLERERPQRRYERMQPTGLNLCPHTANRSDITFCDLNDKVCRLMTDDRCDEWEEIKADLAIEVIA